METTAVMKAHEQRQAINNVLLISQVLLTALERLPDELQFNHRESILKIQRRYMPLLPQDAQVWVNKILQQDLFNVLPVAIRNHVRAGACAAGSMYERLNILMEYLANNKQRAHRPLNEEKFALLLDFIEQEVTAEITGGTPALCAVNGNLVFNLVKPTPGTTKISHDEL